MQGFVVERDITTIGAMENEKRIDDQMRCAALSFDFGHSDLVRVGEHPQPISCKGHLIRDEGYLKILRRVVAL